MSLLSLKLPPINCSQALFVLCFIYVIQLFGDGSERYVLKEKQYRVIRQDIEIPSLTSVSTGVHAGMHTHRHKYTQMHTKTHRSTDTQGQAVLWLAELVDWIQTQDKERTHLVIQNSGCNLWQWILNIKTVTVTNPIICFTTTLKQQ